MSKNVIIVDNNFIDAAEQIAAYGIRLGDALREFSNIMEYIIEYAVLDEKIRAKLISLKEQLAPLENEVLLQTREVQSSLKSYITEVDEADQFLY